MATKKGRVLHSQKLIQSLQLFTSKDGFLKDVKKLRSEWYIPDEGIKDYSLWLKSLLHHPRIGRDGREYLEIYVLYLFKKRIKATNAKEAARKNSNELLRSVSLSEMDEDIKRLSIKNGLSTLYEQPLWAYILYNVINTTYIPRDNVRLKKEMDEYKKPHIYLEIFPETTTKDIQGIWPLVQRYKSVIFSMKPGKRFKKRKKIAVSKRVLDLYRQGKTTNDIQQIIKNEYPGTTYIYKDIITIKRRFNKTLKDI